MDRARDSRTACSSHSARAHLQLFNGDAGGAAARGNDAGQTVLLDTGQTVLRLALSRAVAP